MKKVLFASLYLMASVFMLTACSDDDDNNNSSEMPQEGAVEVFDELSFLQNSIVSIDSTGTIEDYVCGQALDELAPTELYVGVDNVEEAKEIFLSWIINKESVISIGNNITVSLKNEERQDQGKVYFTAKEQGSMVGEYPLIAEVSFETDIKYVTKLYFISKSSWPNNSGSMFAVGDLYVGDHIANGICIREWTPGQSGLFMILSKYKHRWLDTPTHYRPNKSVASVASNILRKDGDTFKVIFNNAGINLNDDNIFIDELKKFWGIPIGFYTINLHTGKFDWFNFTREKRYMQIIMFGENGVIK